MPSAYGGPAIWMPTGRPSENPAGMLRLGMPVRLNTAVERDTTSTQGLSESPTTATRWSWRGATVIAPGTTITSAASKARREVALDEVAGAHGVEVVDRAVALERASTCWNSGPSRS